MTCNVQVQLARQPEGQPLASDFAVREVPIREVGPGQFLVRNLELSLDPYMRSAIAGRHIGHRRLEPGEVIYGTCIGEVCASRHPDYEEGDLVSIEAGWQAYYLSRGEAHDQIRKVCAIDPLSAHLGAAGMPGLTAWVAVERLAEAKLGQTLLVSAAAGAVGGTAGQLARIKGARAIGLVGSPQKAALVVDRYGFAAAINYRDSDWLDQLRDIADEGIHAYVDCVGGAMLNAIMPLMALGGAVVPIGIAPPSDRGGSADLLSGFNVGLLMARRARMLGLIVYDHFDGFDHYTAIAARLIAEGKLIVHEDRVEGLEHAPAHFERLMRGENVGKAVVGIASRQTG